MSDPATTHMDVDEAIVVHKFRAFTPYFWQALERSELYFPAPAQLNDPYDCQIDLMKAFARMRGVDRIERWGPHVGKIVALSATTGILSFFAGDLDKASLMWTHYADNHRGVCLTYRIPQSFVLSELVGQSRVMYGEEELVGTIAAMNLDAAMTMDVLTPLIKAYLMTKSEIWKYEEEGRLVALNPGAKPIPREWLLQACFGLRTPSEDRERLIRALDDWGYPQCRLAQMEHSSDAIFTLNASEIRRA